MPNEHYQCTASTVIREIAHISALVLETLDKYGAEYFDFCEIESDLLQRKLEEVIKVGARRLVEAIDTM